MSCLPEFKGSIEGYCVNFLTKNLWRLRGTHDHDDAMQEARLTFLRCAARYPLMDTAQHFMALFKTTWSNEFHDLSTKATKARSALPFSDYMRADENGDDYSSLGDSIGETDNEGQLAVMLKQAPLEVLMVLNLFLNAPAELLELAAATWKARGHYSPDGERWAEKALGLKVGANPLKQTKEYFTP